MSDAWAYAAVVALLMGVQALIARLQFGSWLAPGAFFCAIWFAFVVSSLVAAPEYRIWPGVLWFFFMTCTVHVGALLTWDECRACRKTQRFPASRWDPQLRPLALLICMCVALGIAAVAVLLAYRGQSIVALFSPNVLAQIGLQYAILRYSGIGFREPIPYLLLNVLVYLGGLLSGAMFAVAPSRALKLLSWLIFLPGLAISMVLTTRASLLYLGMNWLSAYLACRICLEQSAAWFRLGARTATLAVMLVVALIIFYVALQAVRSGAVEKGEGTTQQAIEYGLANAKAAYIGSLTAFSIWFERDWDIGKPLFLGRYTFASLMQWLGYRFQRFEDAQISPDPDAPVTNVYTLYRQLGEDFSLPGSLLIMLAFGALGTVAFRQTRLGRSMYVVPLAVVYHITIGSLTGFSLRDSTLQLAMVMFLIYVSLSSRVQRRVLRDGTGARWGNRS